ncbi:MAG: 50S ribosomal protein L3 [Clostridiales bacterium]|nr:50S ribosomal protein L3 [Clostridiales bacterium]
MPKALLGKKLGMTQVFSPEGRLIPVTVIAAGPCHITQIKSAENDGYTAVQIGFGELKAAKANKPTSGHCAVAKVAPQRYFKELRTSGISDYTLGQELTVELFAAGDKVDISGISKGKGFAGTIKRWNDSRGPMSHGSKNHRRPASAGAKGPARVFKGKQSPGHLGHEKVTIQNLEIVRVDSERNLLLVKGAVPGPKEGLLFIKGAIKSA